MLNIIILIKISYISIMTENKKRVSRLIEKYINGMRGSAIQEIYGKGSYIKIHNITFSVTRDSILIESVVILGDLIKEDYLDNDLAIILIEESIVYFFPECSVNIYVRFDV